MRERQGQWRCRESLVTVLTLFLLLLGVACQQQESPLGEEAPEATPPDQPPTLASTPVNSIDAPLHFSDCAFRTGQNAIIGIPANVDLIGDIVLEEGDEIAVFNTEGSICAGAAVWSGVNIAITAWGDDSQTEAVDGLRDDELLQFRWWDASEGRERPIGAVTYTEGTDRFQRDGIHVVESFEIASP